MTHVLQNDRISATIDPARGARLTSFVVDGHELLAEAGCFPMVPWAGRIRDGLLRVGDTTHQLPLSKDGNAIHGLGRTLEWEHAGPGVYRKVLGEPWPDDGVAELTYSLLPDGLRTTLTWTDGGEAPCSLGLHPWFQRTIAGSPVELHLPADAMVERGADALPTGRLVPPTSGPWDDCFHLVGDPRLTWPGALTLELTSTSPWWVVLTERDGTICVEPQTAPPDAFNHPALQPADGWQRSITCHMRVVSVRSSSLGI